MSPVHWSNTGLVLRRPGAVRWRVVHVDPCRQVLTLERDRRWLRGRYRVVTLEAVWLWRNGDTITFPEGRGS